MFFDINKANKRIFSENRNTLVFKGVDPLVFNIIDNERNKHNSGQNDGSAFHFIDWWHRN